jgi:putative chitinase
MPAVLRACTGATAARAGSYASPLTFAMDEYQINTPPRQAAFLSQVGHESGRLAYTKEIWGPTDAQRGYEGRIDLGNVLTGDGEKFLGRGFIQITGRGNYQDVADALCVDCINHPELLELPSWAAQSAAWWWKRHGLNDLADQGAYEAISRRINGGLNGYDDRVALWTAAKFALGVK